MVRAVKLSAIIPAIAVEPYESAGKYHHIPPTGGDAVLTVAVSEVDDQMFRQIRIHATCRGRRQYLQRGSSVLRAHDDNAYIRVATRLVDGHLSSLSARRNIWLAREGANSVNGNAVLPSVPF